MILWLNPAAGISGDMLLGALLDLGAPLDAINAAVASSGLTGWSLEVTPAQRQGLRARQAVVISHDQVSERAAAELIAMIARVQPPEVASIALAAVNVLAETEAAIHGVDVADAHLHELGGIDTVVDLVGTAAALHALGVRDVWSAPVGLGAGETGSSHGRLPVPAPATLAMLRGVPVVGIDTTTETVTPTGAALLLAVGTRYGPMPLMRVESTGYGAGSRDTPGRPNVLTAVLGDPMSEAAAAPGVTEPMTLVETTVDDVTGEVLGQLVERLLEAGAADAWLAPVIGKKGRPAHVVTALSHDGVRDSVERTLLRETGSLGLRRTLVQRSALARSQSSIDVDGVEVGVKRGPYRSKPEFEDLRAAALLSGRSVREEADRVTARLIDNAAGDSAAADDVIELHES